MAQSFNVSVAGAIILAELFRQRAKQGMYQPEWNTTKETLYRSWLARETLA